MTKGVKDLVLILSITVISPEMIDDNGKSKLANYAKNTYFCPSLYSVAFREECTEHPFNSFSESNAQNRVTLAPFIVKEWEMLGFCSAYAHIAKGSVRISHYFTEEMKAEYSRRALEYNHLHGSVLTEAISDEQSTPGATEYFFEKGGCCNRR